MNEFSRRSMLIGATAGSLGLALSGQTQILETTKTARIIVALADNKNQGIVPIKASLGNGQDSGNNLYWGALYGAKSYFKRHDNWQAITSSHKDDRRVLDRAEFSRPTSGLTKIMNVKMVAWDGAHIRAALKSFYNTLADPESEADLVAFVGHNVLMDGLIMPPIATAERIAKNRARNRQAIVLACQSHRYFSDPIRAIGVNPLLMTKGNMAPEAYSLEAALLAWGSDQPDSAVRLAAARSYAKYQKLPLKNATWLFGA